MLYHGDGLHRGFDSHLHQPHQPGGTTAPHPGRAGQLVWQEQARWAASPGHLVGLGRWAARVVECFPSSRKRPEVHPARPKALSALVEEVLAAGQLPLASHSHPYAPGQTTGPAPTLPRSRLSLSLGVTSLGFCEPAGGTRGVLSESSANHPFGVPMIEHCSYQTLKKMTWPPYIWHDTVVPRGFLSWAGDFAGWMWLAVELILGAL